jgi:hypothetical protein
MSDAPWLPLSPSQTAGLLKTLEAAMPDGEGETIRGGTVGPVVERILVALVRTLRAEGDGLESVEEERKSARKRARRAGFMTGALGALGSAPRETVELIEQARAAVDVADELAPGRSDAQLAADLLVVWGLVDDPAQALAFTSETAPDSLLTTLLRDQYERVKEDIPDRWTVRATLKFIWKARVLKDVVETVRGGTGGFVQAVPVVGAIPGAWNAHRGMKRFQKDLRAHLSRGVDPTGATE